MTQDGASAGVSNTPSPNASDQGERRATARLLSARVDAITVAFRVLIPDDRFSALVQAKGDAALVPGGKLAFAVGGHDAAQQTPIYLVPDSVEMAVDRRTPSNGYAIRLVNADATLLVKTGQEYDETGEPAGPSWNVEVSLRATYLATHTWAEAVLFARRLAQLVAGPREPVYAERVRRVDLAADAELETPFDTSSRGQFVGRPRGCDDYAPTLDAENDNAKAGAHATRTHWKKTRDSACTGFSFSMGGALSARLYDKDAELERYEPGHEKRAIEHARWARAGWEASAADSVWRLEFQFRREALAEFIWRDRRGKARQGIHTLDDVTETRDALWSYCTRSWLRLVERDQATRRFRSRVDDRWTCYQSATFGAAADMAVKRERRKRGGVALAGVVGAMHSNLASTGTIKRISMDQEGGETWVDAARKAIEVDLAELRKRLLDTVATEEDGWKYVQARLAKAAQYGAEGDGDTLGEHGDDEAEDEAEEVKATGT